MAHTFSGWWPSSWRPLWRRGIEIGTSQRHCRRGRCCRSASRCTLTHASPGRSGIMTAVLASRKDVDRQPSRVMSYRAVPVHGCMGQQADYLLVSGRLASLGHACTGRYRIHRYCHWIQFALLHQHTPAHSGMRLELWTGMDSTPASDAGARPASYVNRPACLASYHIMRLTILPSSLLLVHTLEFMPLSHTRIPGRAAFAASRSLLPETPT